MSVVGNSLDRFWKHPIGLVPLEQALTVADQSVISVTFFLTAVLIARYSDARQLGEYAVGISVLASLAAFQDSLILQPWIIERHAPLETSTDVAWASSVLFSAGSILALTIGALGFLELYGRSEIVLMTFAVAGALPFVMTREFARRSALARLETGRAMLLDSAAAMIQLSALGWLGLSGRMSAISACAALGGASAITVAGWLSCTRAESAISRQHLRTIFKKTWPLGKWLLLGRVTVQAQINIAYWLVILIAGAATAGVYAACMSIVGLAKPAIHLIGDALIPKLTLSRKNDGGRGLWREAVRNTMVIAYLVLPLSLAVLLMGEPVMRFFYRGTQYEGYGYTLMVLVLVVLAEALTIPASISLAAMKRPRAIVTTRAVGAVLTVVLVCILIDEWGLLGAACGSLGGAAAVGIARWLVFRVRVARTSDPASVVCALSDFTRSADSGQWKITRLGDGVDAETFLVQSNGPPILHGYRSLVAKLYKSGNASITQMVQAQFDSLSNLHAALHGSNINGWMISIPRPLNIHKSPLALLMTEVPGRHIDSYASENEAVTSRNIRDAARAFATSMQLCWSGGRHHGDLGVHNALFDIEAKTISFVDPGTRESCPVCNGDTKVHTLAALDLAHALYDATIDVTDLTGRPTMRVHREVFIENVLLAILEDIESPAKKRRLLEEIRSCVQQHLDDCWEPSLSPRGIWHSFVKQIMTQRISSILDRVIFHTGVYPTSGQL